MPLALGKKSNLFALLPFLYCSVKTWCKHRSSTSYLQIIQNITTNTIYNLKNLWGNAVFVFLSSLQASQVIQLKWKFMWLFSVHIWKGRDYTDKAKRTRTNTIKYRKQKVQMMLFGVQI